MSGRPGGPLRIEPHGHALCAEAEAVFIAVPRERIDALMERRERYEELQVARTRGEAGQEG